MIKVLSCLAGQHDYRLVLVAAVVCLGGTFTAFRIFSRMRQARTRQVQAAWLMLTALVAGSSVWATHFIAVLSYSTGLRSGFDGVGTLASLLLAAVFMAAAFGTAAWGRRLDGKLAAGLLAGSGVAAMHYTGMGAYITEGRLAWDLTLVVASLALGAGLSSWAMVVAGRARTVGRQAAAALVLTLAICSLHFTGMGAVTITPDPTVAVPAQMLSSGVMTLGVTAVVALMIIGGLGAVLIEGGANQDALARIRRLADAAYEGIVVVRDNRIQDANAAFCTMVGASVTQLTGAVLAGELLEFDSDETAIDRRREGWLRPADGGEPIPVEVFSRLLQAGISGSDLMVLAVRDLRERREAEAQIRFLAEHDGLTGLANRHALGRSLAQALERADATGESVAVLCIDLDNFKDANDQNGHQAGDAILAEVARRLGEAAPAPSFAARIGGDEFVLVQVGGAQPQAAERLASALVETLSRPVAHDGNDLPLGASIGVSLYPADGRDGEALLANADLALYRAKDDGKRGYCFFAREMDDAARDRRSIARDLRRAIAEEELVLHYQPLARAADAEVCGFEALVRWRHPTRGMIPPLDFIPVAEESGLIIPLGEWVLRRACADAVGWDRPLRIAVNLSPLQLHQADLPALVHAVLLDTGLSPQRLELEVTESALFKDYQRALDNLRRLKALGVRIAMDDFGTGFSSLSTLQSFPFDKIKIDKSFVENIHRDDRATVIVRAVLGLGRSLDIPVVAEGVETPGQLEFLRGEACTEVQGYAIGRPTPMEALGHWVSDEQAADERAA